MGKLVLFMARLRCMGPLLCVVGLLGTAIWAQQGCPQPPALEKVSGKSIFTERQEIDLGDAAADAMAREFPRIDDPELTPHLDELGARLGRFLPPNEMRFRFFLIELPQATAFSLPGGRIYVAQKMIALTRSDDELAGVLAHEMGHIVTHQHAIHMTRILKRSLGVTEVGDRADIYDKFQRLLENQRRTPVNVDSEGEQDQYIADQVALFAMARAGFAPQSYVDFWDRFGATHESAGNWFTDLLGYTKPEQKRLRELLKWVSMMPADCARIPSSSTTEFETWRARVIASSSGSHVESLPGLIARQKLALPLRPDINNLHFSPDGKYILAQDEGGIHVLLRNPFQLLFFIEAPGADKAQFTPDSKAVVFESPSLRVETWGIESRKRTALHDVLLPTGCLQSAVSSDGRTIACLDDEFALRLLDVETGRQLGLRKKFLDPGSAIFPASSALERDSYRQLTRLAFSPDAHYFLAGSTRTEFAYDLRANHPIKLPSRIKEVLHGEFTFIDGEHLIGLNSSNPAKSPLLTFPSGQRLQHVALTYAVHLKPTAQGRHIAVGPLKSGKRGFMDPTTGKLDGICKEDAGDIYDNTVVYEEIDGRILQVEASSGKIIDRVQLSQSHLGGSRAIEVSPDFNWLAASTTSRGAMWDISQNARVQYVRAFTEGWFGEDDQFYADFPPGEKQERALVGLNQQGGTSPVYSPGQLLASQEGPYVLVRMPSRGNPYQRKDWTYELRDFRSRTVVWTRRFPKEPPTLAWTPDYKTVLLGWPVATAAAHDELKAHPQLKRSAEKDDMLYELVDVRADAVVSGVIVKTNQYSFRIKGAKVDRDWAALEVSGDRVLIYSLRSGIERGHVFGNAAAISSAGGLYAVSAGDGDVSVYQLADSHLRQTYRFPASVAFKKFSADGKRLFVLTGDQTAYILDLDAAGNQSPVAVKTLN